jgi:hypothetical protein
MSAFVAPTGYVDLNNEDYYSLDNKSTRSRETVVPKDDLAFYFNTYIVPKYGLNNINVSNCASFMKELQMNWSKMDNQLKDNVMDILVDGILTGDNYDFKNKLTSKLNINSTVSPNVPSGGGGGGSFAPSGGPSPAGGGGAGVFEQMAGKSTFGSMGDPNRLLYFAIGVLVLGVLLFFLDKFLKTKPSNYSRLS